eukprot:m.126641 g.126641  ORF g.126641 m.126641 type:complete len:86 (-) comp29216_c0_seq3:12-269(-)
MTHLQFYDVKYDNINHKFASNPPTLLSHTKSRQNTVIDVKEPKQRSLRVVQERIRDSHMYAYVDYDVNNHIARQHEDVTNGGKTK